MRQWRVSLKTDAAAAAAAAAKIITMTMMLWMMTTQTGVQLASAADTQLTGTF